MEGREFALRLRTALLREGNAERYKTFNCEEEIKGEVDVKKNCKHQ